MKEVDVAVLGGGPAGITAAIELAKGGAELVVVDAYPRPGGHYFKQPPEEFATTTREGDGRQAEYDALMDAFARSNVDLLSETAAWSILPSGDGNHEFTVYLQGPHDVEAIRARYLLLAPGAYDRPLAFPGWHLPGVITPGAAQMLLKGQGIRPGQRALVAGSGPLLLAAAAALVEAGTEVRAVLDVASPWDGLRQAPRAFWGQKERLKEGWHYGTTLLRHRVPLLFGHTVFEALGEHQVSAVSFGRIDDDGRPLPETASIAEVDTVCVGLGFLPNLALTRHLGCEHGYDETLDAYYPVHDASMETTTPNVFVAGDVTGIGGKEMAKIQGQVAGLNILAKMGKLAPSEFEARQQALGPPMAGEERFVKMLRERMRDRPGLLELIDEDTVVCRCEMVTAGEIRRAIAAGGFDIRGIKLRTRCGMGPCQGRYCEASVANLIAAGTGRSRPEVGVMSVRPPLIPMLMADIIA